MQKRNRFFAPLVLVFAAAAAGGCGPSAEPAAGSSGSAPDPLATPLPVDPQVTIGKLANGLTYYVERNTEPEKRAVLRLVVDAGSVLEDDDQLGLAHVVEHMAFNGTTNFSGNALIEYLESIGIKFGAHLNAHTSFDETVYKLQVPSDDQVLLEKGLQVLAEWAGGITFDPAEVEKERGVVLEEWRRSRGAGGRLRDKIVPLTFHDSRYKDRLPIGTEDSLRSFGTEQLVRFYQDWYRPSLMAVVAVGDFDVTTVVKQIEAKFGALKDPAPVRERVRPQIPEHAAPQIGVFTDPEISSTSITIMSKLDDVEGETHRAYRDMFIERLAADVVNERFAEVSRDPSSPLLGAGTGKRRLTPTEGAHTLGAGVKEGQAEAALTAMLTEIRRAKEFGISAPELQRAVLRSMQSMETYYTERETTHSRAHAAEIVRVFTTGEAMPGIEYEYELAKRFLPQISVDEVNAFLKSWMAPTSRVITVVAPKKEGSTPPPVARVAAIVEEVAAQAMQANAAEEAAKPLMGSAPAPGTIVERREIKELGVTEWILSNGAKVLLKPTDFKADEILMQAYSWGGTATVDDDTYVSAQSALPIGQLSGLGELDALELRKTLAGQRVSASPWVGEQLEGMRGTSSRDDLERMFQLNYLWFTSQRLDAKGLQLYTSQRSEALRNRLSAPSAAFGDAFTELMWQDFARYRPWTVETLEKVDIEKSRSFLRERFANAGDFVFVLAGSFTLEEIEPKVLHYLASLPGEGGKREGPIDVGAKRNPKVADMVVRRGLDPKASVRFSLHGKFENTRDNRYLMNAMSEVLSVRLREELREKLGGTYSVGARMSLREKPVSDYAISISFQADPDRVGALSKRMMEVVEELRAAPPAAKYVEQIQAQHRRQRETSVRTNGFWAAMLLAYERRGEPLADILAYDKLVDGLTAKRLHEAAKRWLVRKPYVKVVLMPKVPGGHAAQ